VIDLVGGENNALIESNSTDPFAVSLDDCEPQPLG
jgi:hypothetical protein